MSSSIPRIEKLNNGNRWQLVIDDKPFLIRGGELNNSSFSSGEYMDTVWQKLVDMNLNTILGAVQWEQIEPEEGKFDFEELEKVIKGARSHGIKVIILWFGAYKNGDSTYAPPWVKLDSKRFPRTQIRIDGTKQIRDVLSLFGPDLLEADKKAFVQVMKHIKKIDADHRTVIMAQVENEVGVLKDSRDRGPLAEKVFNAAPDASVIDALRKNIDSFGSKSVVSLKQFKESSFEVGSSWDETFGESTRTDELFSAIHYAKYINAIAQAGKEVYPIPMYANAWLPEPEAAASGGHQPGGYPSGGPVPRVIDFYRTFAPSLDFLAPDIYFPGYDGIIADYRECGQALFIPEQQGDEFGLLRTWVAIGNADAIGVAPFGIDTDPYAPVPVTSHYKLLAKVTPLILQARQDGLPTFGLYFDAFERGKEDPSHKWTFEHDGWVLQVSRAMVFGHPKPGYGLIIPQKDGKFLLIGEGFQVDFTTKEPSPLCSILSFNEMEVVDGGLVRRRFLNGDEISHFSKPVARMPTVDPDYADVRCSILIPSRTKVALVQPYAPTN